MEELEVLLMQYNQVHPEDLEYSPWSTQYTQRPFPIYWRLVYQIMEKLDRNYRVTEVGCGQGDVTSIFCHLGFANIYAYEREPMLVYNAQRRITDLFHRKGIVTQRQYPTATCPHCDVLVVVNCTYKDMASHKDGYKQLILDYYSCAGRPRYLILEVIDASYTAKNEDFPEYLRLSRADIAEMFPGFRILSWPTYTYPRNRKSKTLYLIERV